MQVGKESLKKIQCSALTKRDVEGPLLKQVKLCVFYIIYIICFLYQGYPTTVFRKISLRRTQEKSRIKKRLYMLILLTFYLLENDRRSVETSLFIRDFCCVMF